MPYPTRSPHAPTESHLLAALPLDEYDRILAHADIKSLKLRDVLYRPGSPLDYVYFPRSGALSTILIIVDGQSAEVAAVGIAVMIGIPAFLGAEASSVQVICQIPGEVARMPVSAFAGEGRRGGPLHEVLSRYT
ncbi:Crp/Fnr family transcriptional regulator [Singulisphaera sp. Ch08]|uniref:Crp/Fnr family transcriptional regulator n=1 Tax=Singulisphaera sp. Ch08 TaxID=3120278 RepID=A0AAU7CEE5_9BACT